MASCYPQFGQISAASIIRQRPICHDAHELYASVATSTCMQIWIDNWMGPPFTGFSAAMLCRESCGADQVIRAGLENERDATRRRVKEAHECDALQPI